MRTRLSKSDRRAAILAQAAELFVTKGLTATEMEDIRRACDISRGGLYHHFASKTAILDALVADEVSGLAAKLDASDKMPVLVLLERASTHLGAEAGLMGLLRTRDERLDYLRAFEQACDAILLDALERNFAGHLREDVTPSHVAGLFLTMNSYINRREVLGDWTAGQSAAFAATALQALSGFLRAPDAMAPVISSLKARAAQ